MKKSRKLFAFLSIALLAVVIVFAACKKDDEKSVGTKAADDLCGCASATTESAAMSCFLNFYSNYGQYIEIDIPDNDDDDINITFKDANFEKDFTAAIQNCTAFWE